jgi:hypothetical protein
VSFEKIEISGNYRVITEGYIQAYVMYYNPYPNSTCIDGVQRTTGYKKILGIWFKNKSNLQQGGHGTLVYNFNNGGDVTVSVYHNYWAGDDYQDCEVHTRWRTLDGYPNTLTFYYSHYDVYGISSNVANPADTICGS